MEDLTAAEGATRRRSHLVDLVVDHRWLVLVALALLVSVRAIGHGHGDWDFFVGASRALTGSSGLHLYATHSDVVTGPLSLLVIRGTAGFGVGGSYATGVVLANLLAVGGLALLERTAACFGRARPLSTLLAGVILLVSWSELAGFGHLDDAMALVAVIAAFYGIGTRRGLLVGLALGIAIASKQWGVMFIPLALVLPGRERWRALLVSIGVGALAWAPFVIAAPKMLSQRSMYQIVANDSAFGVFDYPKLQGPTWVRAAQIIGGLVLVSFAVWRGRWPAAILAAVAFRVLLDPATWSYYTAAVVLGACAWDLIGSRRVVPAWALAMFLLLAEATVLVDDSMLRGGLRLVACLLALVPLGGRRIDLDAPDPPPAVPEVAPNTPFATHST
jgi:hypothetical protein